MVADITINLNIYNQSQDFCRDIICISKEKQNFCTEIAFMKQSKGQIQHPDHEMEEAPQYVSFEHVCAVFH
jgi:hypothetical protein